MTGTIQQHLAQLGMSGSPQRHSGLLPVIDLGISKNSPHEIVALISARDCQADYVYFRRFADGRPSLPQVYVYDNTKKRLTPKEVGKIHQKVWNRGQVPLMYVFSLASVDIFSCAREADFLSPDGEVIFNPAKTLELAKETQNELDRFSGQMFDSGLFWINPENFLFINRDKASHQSLINAIFELDSRVVAEGCLPQEIGRRLLILCILVKYLEDRKVFPTAFFQRFLPTAKCFFDVLQKAESTIRFFENLENHFNGDVFSLSVDEKKAFTNANLKKFAEFIEAKTYKGQMHFWELYTFEDIPVEIISYIYENFVSEKSAVYTPHFLVDLLLDENMNLQDLGDDFRILDPACGSGVFLVGALKRLILSWRIRNRWEEPDPKTLKNLLKRNIFGVDCDKTAVELTSFSLCLALCDSLKPDVIWKKLKFDQLKDNNIFEKDFFQHRIEAKFDLLIGNPPFVSELSTQGSKEVNKEYERVRGALPDTQIAYLFLEHGMRFLKNQGKLCLILPHGMLYNYNVQKFRGYIFSSWHVEEVFDFISIRHLFSADAKVCAFVVQNCSPDHELPVTHITFRRNKNTQEKLFFEIDHYDIHQVPRDLAISQRLIWRANLLGGARVFSIIERVTCQRTLDEYISAKGWDFGEGFIAAQKGANKKAPFITGKNFLPTNAFTDNGIDETKIEKAEEENFKCPYTKSRYTPPMILIKEHSALPIEFWTKSYLTFRDKIVSISNGHECELKSVYDRIKTNHRNFQFFLSLIGSQALTGRTTAVNKMDLGNLPFPEKPEQLSLSKFEEIIRDDILDYIEEFVRKGEDSKLLKSSASEKQLEQFGDIFCELLGSVYSAIRPHVPIFLSEFVCFPFYFGKKPNMDFGDQEKFSKDIQALVLRRHKKTLHVSRIIRLYEKNVILLIKPKSLRYWLRSIALRDADETFAELREQGY